MNRVNGPVNHFSGRGKIAALLFLAILEIQRALDLFLRPARYAVQINHCRPDVSMPEYLRAVKDRHEYEDRTRTR